MGEQTTVHLVEMSFLKLSECFKDHVEVYPLYCQCQNPTSNVCVLGSIAVDTVPAEAP